MPIPVVCASCAAKLVAPDAAAGKKVKCRNCQAVIAVPVPAVAEEESDFEFVEPTPPTPAKPAPRPVVAATPVKPKAKPAVVVEDDEEDDTPKPKKKSKAAIVAEDDEDEYDTPKKGTKKPKIVAVEEDDENDEDDAPRKGKKGAKGKQGKKPAKKTNPLMLVGLGGVALLAITFLGVMVWYVAIRGDTATVASSNPTANGPALGGPFQPPGGSGNQPPNPLAGWTKYEKPGYTIFFKDSVGPAKSQSGVQQGVKVEGMTAGEGEGSKNGFLMVTTEFPPAVFDVVVKNPRQALDGGVNGMKRDGKVLSEKDITFDGHPGREVRLQQKDGSEGIMRWVLAHGRLYVFGVIEPGITEASETYKTFFGNVTLKAGGGNQPPPTPPQLPPGTDAGKLYEHKLFSVRIPTDATPPQDEGSEIRTVYRANSIVISIFSDEATRLAMLLHPNDPVAALKDLYKSPKLTKSASLTTKDGFPAHQVSGPGVIQSFKSVVRAIYAHGRIYQIEINAPTVTDQDAHVLLMFDSFQPKK